MPNILFDKDDKGRWILTWPIAGTQRVLTLRVEFADWHEFTAAIVDSQGVEELGSFEAAPAELWPETSPLVDPEVPRWDPLDEDDFVAIPKFHPQFAAMVRAWGQIVSAVNPVMPPEEGH